MNNILSQSTTNKYNNIHNSPVDFSAHDVESNKEKITNIIHQKNEQIKYQQAESDKLKTLLLEDKEDIHTTTHSGLPSTARFDGKELSANDKQLLEEQYKKIVEYNNIDMKSSPDRKEFEHSILPKGTLIHGSKYTPETIRSVAQNGILSGELLGISEDGETHYCADFFRVPETQTIQDYMQRVKTLEQQASGLKLPKMEKGHLIGSKICYIIDTHNPILQDLSQYDAYGTGYDRLQSIIHHLPKEKGTPEFERLSAILGGVPSSTIQGIIIGERVIKQPEQVADIKSVFGPDMIYFSENGEKI